MNASRPPAFFKFPENALDWIRDEHDRQLTLLNNFDCLLSRGPFDRIPHEAERLALYLTRDAVMHTQDEEENLFPLMKLRCKAEDEIDALLLHLSWEHNVDRFLTIHTIIDLRNLNAMPRLHQQRELRHRLGKFIETQQRHINQENDSVLPLARRRLTHKDIEDMGRHMIARRNSAKISSNNCDPAAPRVPIRERFSEGYQSIISKCKFARPFVNGN